MAAPRPTANLERLIRVQGIGMVNDVVVEKQCITLRVDVVQDGAVMVATTRCVMD